MTSKQERLKEVYNHLRSHFGIHTQIDFAEAIHITRPALSSAMNGNEAYLTKNLFQKICASYPGVFNLDYLLTSKGELLAPSSSVDSSIGMVSSPEPAPTSVIPSWADAFFNIMTQQIKQNEALNRELRQSIADVNALKSDLTDLLHKIKKDC
jgi:hypothetical protein